QRKDTVKEEHRKILERLAGLTLRSPEQRSWVQRQITTLTDPHYLERTSTTRQREFEQIDAQIHRIQIEDRKYDEIDPNRIGLEKAIPSIKSNLDAIQSSKLEYAPAEAFLKQACAYFRYHLERVERSLPQIQTPDQMDEAKAQFTIIVNELAPLADLLKQLFPADASEEKKAEGLKTLQNIVPINTEALANKALFELGNMIKNYQIHEALRTSAQSALNRINTELPNTQKQGDNAVFKLVAVSCYKVLQSVQNGRRVEAAISREQEFLEQSTEILRDSDEAKAYEALLKTRPQSFEDAAVDEWNVKLNQAKNKVLDLHRTSLETRIRELESKAGAVDVPKVLRLGLPKEVQALRARTEESDFAKFETDVLQIHADCQSLLRSVEAPNHPLADPMKKRLLDHAKEAALHEMEKLKESVEDYALHDEVDDIKSEIDRLRVRNLSNPMLGSLTEYDALLSPPRLDSIREMIGNEPLHPSRLQEELLKHLKDENGPYAKAL
ncbi:MAG: hypothetical protein KDK78_11150, partial [Chlamydiia bacterium]|nr:hypothetical protein [Chlamydiia bacterium]